MEQAVTPDPGGHRLEKVKQAILSRFPREKNPKFSLLEKALADAEFFHANQWRKSGEPAIIHPLRVALLVSEAGMDIEAVIIALLHDILEDTEITKAEVEARYGEWMAAVVDGLTKVATPRGAPRRDRASIETFRKLLNSTVKDIRTLQVKIFDRLDNMRDLGFLARPRQRSISMETLLVYVPMVQRLGMQEIANELTTLCFRYLYPRRFKRVLSLLKERIRKEQRTIKGTLSILEKTLEGLGGKPFVIRPRYFQVSDYVFSQTPVTKALAGFAVSVPAPEDCYAVLGALHMKHRVVPNSIRDYISNPKPNRHQALETQIFIGREPVLIETCSREMEAVNRRGILADWKMSRDELTRYYLSYLELLDQFDGNEDLRMEDVLRYAQMETLQLFTPIGEVFTFPQGATVLDFAFAIHSDLGVHCDGAWVEGRRASRFEELKDGTMVKVLTSSNVGPDRHWLDHVRTTRAKMAIRRHLKTKTLRRAGEVGQKLFFAELTRMRLDPEEFSARPEFQKALRSRRLSPAEFYRQIGMRKIQPRLFLLEKRLISDAEFAEASGKTPGGILRYLKRRPKTTEPDLIIPDFGNEFIHLGVCCSPLRGDPIVGVQGEGGIFIHRKRCGELERAEPDALLSVGWEAEARQNPYRLNLSVADRPGLIYKIGKIMRDLNVNIQDLGVVRVTKEGTADIRIQVEPIPVRTYRKIVARLRNIKEILKIS